MEGAGTGAFILAVVALFALLVIIAVDDGSGEPQAKQSDIQAACARHQGVRQIIDTSDKPIKGTVTVVCEDGRVVRAK